MVEFKDFGKIPRLNREVVITEKIDGTNACVVVEDEIQLPAWYDWWSDIKIERKVYAQNRNRLLTPENDNAGFAKWVQANAEELKNLGPGYHYGEWWGSGIGRKYGMKEKIFSLFNVYRWHKPETTFSDLQPGQEFAPTCCSVVPTFPYSKLEEVPLAIEWLKEHGSVAVPGFMDPEGVIIWHDAAKQYFKVTIKGDESPKSKT